MATLYRKALSAITPDYCNKETQRWVVFPCDAKDTVQKNYGKKPREKCGQHKRCETCKGGLAQTIV